MKHFFLSLVTIAVLQTVTAEIRMPKFFSDNMVLQRERPIRIWGWASRNESVSVLFNGTQVSAGANRMGRWQVELPAMPHGGPYEMIIRGSRSEIRFTNILLGDVWLCSGQSNMEWPLDPTTGCEEEIAASANPNLRLLTVEKAVSPDEMEDLKGGAWVECTPETSRSFSAVAYYFGKFVQRETGVPIGLINSSWGGTDIEPWTSWETMRKTEQYREYADRNNTRAAMGESLKRWERYDEALQNDPGEKEYWYKPEIAVRQKGWAKMYVPKLWEDELGEINGNVWFRTTVTLPESASGQQALLSLPAVDDADVTYLNGQQIGTTNGYNRPRRYAIPEGVLRAGENLIAIRVFDRVAAGGIWGDAAELYLEVGGKRYGLAGEWEYKPSATTAMYGVTMDATHPNNFAALLYNGMIHPLTSYGIRGVIWYQGENNAPRARSYRQLFPNLIRDWRTKWGYEVPFLWVQLAGYMAIEDQPAESSWAELREAQNNALILPATGQAVITDIGDANDIHPRNKRDVGYRLCRSALKVAYGRKIVASGPTYRSMEHDGNRIILTFGTTDGGLRPADDNRYGYLRGFTIAGADRKFVRAKAWVLDKNRIAVFSDEVPEPVAVRYGWADNPYDNDLTNCSGLPASPFRTDDWPGITR